MEYNKICQSKTFKITLWILGALILSGVSFNTGMFVGFKKAGFSYKWGENYHRNFGGPRGGIMGAMNDFVGRDMMNANGVAGQIINIDGRALLINGRDNVEKIILLKPDSILKEHMSTISRAELKVGDFVVVIGDANDQGQIEAKFIRVMPASSEFQQTPKERFYRGLDGRRGMGRAFFRF